MRRLTSIAIALGCMLLAVAILWPGDRPHFYDSAAVAEIIREAE